MDKAPVVDSDNESYLAERAHEVGAAKLGAIFCQAEASSIRRLVFQFLKQPFGWCSSPSLWTLAATISTPALPYYARSFHVNNAAVGYLYVSWCLFQR